VLEHIQAAKNRFPFAYLDFDRTTISAGSPAELLAEMCIQVAAQFPQLSEQLYSVRARLAPQAGARETIDETSDTPSLSRCCYEFRIIVDEHLASFDSLIGAPLPFLLVLDTFELVQSNPGGLDQINSFVCNFLAPDFVGVKLDQWPRLRLVLSGRRPVPDFLGATERWEVDALDRNGSTAMLMALAENQGCPLGRRLAARLVDAVARSIGPAQKGVRPLRLHLVAQALQARPDVSADAMVDELIGELARQDSALQRQLVDGILIRRILGHVGDRRVRDLSDPGLVIRHIDPDIIRDVIAPATPTPAASLTGGVGYPLAVGEEYEIFEAFRHQVTLIEDHQTSVRHIQDVRREMMPLIRAHRPELFAELHRRAYRYFFARSADPRAAAEAIYHGLWSGAPIEELERLWNADPRPDPRLDPDEFALDAGVHAYVRARIGQELRLEEVSGLPPHVRFEWLAARMPTYLRSRRPEDTIATVELVSMAAHLPLEPPDLIDGAVQLLYRTGRWRTAHDLARKQLAGVGASLGPQLARYNKPVSSLLRTLTRIEAHTGEPDGLLLSIGDMMQVKDASARLEMLLNLLARHGARGNVAEVLRIPLAKELELARQSLDHRSRRLALLLVPEFCYGLLPAHIGASESLPRDPEIFGLMLNMVREVANQREAARLDRAAEQITAGRAVQAYDALDDAFRESRRDIVGLAAEADPRRSPYAELLRYSHFDWHAILAASLQMSSSRGHGNRILAMVAQFAAQDTQHAIIAGNISGRRALAAVAANGQLLALARELVAAAPPGDEGSDDFTRLCRSLAGWHESLAVLQRPEADLGSTIQRFGAGNSDSEVQ
jgi:hypothetical protein